jgi:hypothetical protein
MNCYLHALQYEEVPAVAVCRNCGVAMCMEHLAEQQANRPGGMSIGCTHNLPEPRDATVSRHEARAASFYS